MTDHKVGIKLYTPKYINAKQSELSIRASKILDNSKIKNKKLKILAKSS